MSSPTQNPETVYDPILSPNIQWLITLLIKLTDEYEQEVTPVQTELNRRAKKNFNSVSRKEWGALQRKRNALNKRISTVARMLASQPEARAAQREVHQSAIHIVEKAE